MKAKDIINRLAAKLPALVDDFSDSFSISSLTRSGTTVTATTTAAHGLAVNRGVNIVGAKTPIEVISVTRVGILGTVNTKTDHDMTEGAFTTVELSGANEAEFNGTFTINRVLNRREITFIIADSGPTSSTGAPLLLNGSSVLQSYNGLKKVTATPSATTFQYEVSDPELFTPAAGTISVKVNARISGAATEDRAVDAYTEQNPGDAWIFVVMNDAVASKNRSLEIDGTDNIQRTQHFKQFISQTVSLYVAIPTSDTIGGRQARDRAQELFQPICQSILFAKFDSLLTSGEYNALMFNEHGFQAYNTAFYIHRYTFEIQLLMGIGDTVGADEDVAFRDIEMTQGHNVGTGEIMSNIDLDDEPIPAVNYRFENDSNFDFQDGTNYDFN